MPAPVEAGSGVAASAPVAVDLVGRASVVWVVASAVAQGSPLAASAVAEVWVASVALLAAQGLLLAVYAVAAPSQPVVSVLPLAALAGAGSLAIEAASIGAGATGTELPG